MVRKSKIDIRRDAILELLHKEERVYVSKLSKLLGATEVTIRSDLTVLEQQKKLMRVQGGAVLYPEAEKPVISNSSQKEAIANAVTEMIGDGDTLFINCGTTTLCVAQALKQRRNLNVVTNSISVATALADIPTIRVLLLGGELNAQYGFTYGANAQEQLSQYQARWAILAVDGVSKECGVTTYHAEEAILDRMMIEGAGHALIVADSSKIGRAGFSRICECNGQLTLVTDDADPVIMAELKESEMKIKIV